jgi:hypothetical protein
MVAYETTLDVIHLDTSSQDCRIGVAGGALEVALRVRKAPGL